MEGVPCIEGHNIYRPDWGSNHDCVKGLRFGDGRTDPEAPKSLAARYVGIERALWMNWCHEPSVNQMHIRNYVRPHGIFESLPAIMSPHLPADEWLNLEEPQSAAKSERDHLHRTS